MLRAGAEFGAHTVGLDGPAEVLELTHRARSRAVFARGALLAARWVRGRKGLYTFDHSPRKPSTPCSDSETRHDPASPALSVALATPFTPDFAVDLPAFRRLVRHVVAGGADGLVVLGSTGEAATILEAERDALITACLEEAGACPVVVGTGSNATRAGRRLDPPGPGAGRPRRPGGDPLLQQAHPGRPGGPLSRP